MLSQLRMSPISPNDKVEIDCFLVACSIGSISWLGVDDTIERCSLRLQIAGHKFVAKENFGVRFLAQREQETLCNRRPLDDIKALDSSLACAIAKCKAIVTSPIGLYGTAVAVSSPVSSLLWTMREWTGLE